MTSDAAKGLSSAGNHQAVVGTSFEEATSVFEEDGDSRYRAVIPADWCFGPVAHGGFLSALLTRAVAHHLRNLTRATSRQVPNTLGSSGTTYFAPVIPGPVHIEIKDRSLTKSAAYFVASLYQHHVPADPSSPSSLRVEANVSMTTAAGMYRTNLSRPMNPRLRINQPDIYPRHAKGHHIPHLESGMSFYKHKPGWECYFNPKSIDRVKFLNPHHTLGPAVFDVWWKLDHDIGVHELGFIADLIGPVLFNYEDVRKTHWLSTRQMSVDIVRLPEEGQSGWERLFCRMELIENVGDRFYCDVTIADEEGKVVGIARQSCIVRPFELVGKQKTGSGNVGSKKDKAKI